MGTRGPPLRSGLTVPRRRTLTAPIVGFVRSVLTRFGILPALVSKRRLPGHGQPLAEFIPEQHASDGLRRVQAHSADRIDHGQRR
jgi:hypothetical protein